jgi:hypothetical protein
MLLGVGSVARRAFCSWNVAELVEVETPFLRMCSSLYGTYRCVRVALMSASETSRSSLLT